MRVGNSCFDKVTEAVKLVIIPYLKALFWLWGIKGFEVVARENFDYLPQEKIELLVMGADDEKVEETKKFETRKEIRRATKYIYLFT